jgi:hypothetical protein
MGCGSAPHAVLGRRPVLGWIPPEYLVHRVRDAGQPFPPHSAGLPYSGGSGGAVGWKKRTAPGALQPEPLRCPGQLKGTNHPPMVDLLALASRSTSHRPSCPKAWRAMPLFGPVPGCPVRCRHVVVPSLRASPGPRTGAVRAAAPVRQLGWHTLASARFHLIEPSGEPVGPPMWIGGIRPCTVSADVDLPKRGPGPFSGGRHPKVTSTRLGSPVPVAAALSGTRHTLQPPSPQVKRYFRMHRVLPRTFPLRTGNPRSSTVHAQRCAQPAAGLTGGGCGSGRATRCRGRASRRAG